MKRLESALERLNAAIDRVEAASGELSEREHAIRTEAAETVAAALIEMRRAASAMQEQSGKPEGGEGRADG